MNTHINKNRPTKKRADHGSTPVLDGSTPAPNPIVSIRDRINAATTEEEITALQDECDRAERASAKTRRRWIRAVQARVAFLKAKKQ